MKTEKTIFHAEDFEGSGQYVIENREDHYKDTGYMTTLMYKVCYGSVNGAALLVSMTDGMVLQEFNAGPRLIDNKRALCDYLNAENYRPVKHEELIRMALHQHRRCG